MIDCVIIPNLKRREDKWYFLLGTLYSAGFPIEKEDYIIRFDALDGKDYCDDLEVRDAAIADGFSSFARYDGQHNRMSATRMAWHWTWNSVMRTIAEMPGEKVVLFIIDDMYPRKNYPFGRIEGLVEEARRIPEHKHGKFRGIQLSVNINSNLYIRFQPPINSSVLRYGWIGCNDRALVLTPKCAEMLMDIFSQEIRGIRNMHNVMITLGNRSEKEDRYYKGLWHTVENVFGGDDYFGNDVED